VSAFEKLPPLSALTDFISSQYIGLLLLTITSKTICDTKSTLQESMTKYLIPQIDAISSFKLFFSPSSKRSNIHRQSEYEEKDEYDESSPVKSVQRFEDQRILLEMQLVADVINLFSKHSFTTSSNFPLSERRNSLLISSALMVKSVDELATAKKFKTTNAFAHNSKSEAILTELITAVRGVDGVISVAGGPLNHEGSLRCVFQSFKNVIEFTSINKHKCCELLAKSLNIYEGREQQILTSIGVLVVTFINFRRKCLERILRQCILSDDATELSNELKLEVIAGEVKEFSLYECLQSHHAFLGEALLHLLGDTDGKQSIEKARLMTWEGMELLIADLIGVPVPHGGVGMLTRTQIYIELSLCYAEEIGKSMQGDEKLLPELSSGYSKTLQEVREDVRQGNLSSLMHLVEF